MKMGPVALDQNSLAKGSPDRRQGFGPIQSPPIFLILGLCAGSANHWSFGTTLGSAGSLT
jgi:hypothetical protein